MIRPKFQIITNNQSPRNCKIQFIEEYIVFFNNLNHGGLTLFSVESSKSSCSIVFNSTLATIGGFAYICMEVGRISMADFWYSNLIFIILALPKQIVKIEIQQTLKKSCLFTLVYIMKSGGTLGLKNQIVGLMFPKIGFHIMVKITISKQ